MKGIALVLTLLMFSGCWGGQHHNPLAQVNIQATANLRGRILDATKEFGERNGFAVSSSNNLPRDGRLVNQVLLTRPDGVLITSSNFMHEDTLQTFFMAEIKNADWRSAKAKWLAEVRRVAGSQARISEISLEGDPKSE